LTELCCISRYINATGCLNTIMSNSVDEFNFVLCFGELKFSCMKSGIPSIVIILLRLTKFNFVYLYILFVYRVSVAVKMSYINIKLFFFAGTKLISFYLQTVNPNRFQSTVVSFHTLSNLLFTNLSLIRRCII
jgi:hypothetical protein